MLEILLAAAIVAGPGPLDDCERVRLPSLHMLEHMENGGRVTLHVDGADGGRSLSGTVYGFLPYWGGDTWLRYDLISILACFCVDMNASGDISAWNGFPEVFEDAIDGINGAGGTAVVTVVNFSSSSIHSILTTGRDNAIATIVDLVDQYPVEGVSIDFENVSGSDRDNLTSFMEELRNQLDLNVPGSHLSICTPAVDWSGAFDYQALAQTADALFMMCYPFHGSWSTVAGPCCPLTGWGSNPESSSNMVWCLGDYARYAPGCHDRVVVGLPYYGFEWETAGSSTHSAVTGDCTTLVYSTLAGRAELYGRLWDGESLTPWYAYYGGGWNQGWYDDQESLQLKYDLIRASDLQGAGIWALGYDGAREELWDCLEESFCSGAWTDSVTDNLESRFQAGGPAQYWRNVTQGGEFYGCFYTYSISSGPDVNWAEWTFQLPDSSMFWMLEAYIPAGGTATVRYRIESGGGLDTVVVDQSLYGDQWVPLGGPREAGQGLRVILGDHTGQTGDKIMADAIRFTAPEGIGGGSRETGAEGISLMSPNPSTGFTFSLPGSFSSGRLTIYDITGRAVSSFTLDDGRCARTVTWPLTGRHPPGVYTAVLSGTTAASSVRLVLLGY
ncbi:MAG: T9SS type A sorting domain-containing protein [Candidatus Fermentibacteraceae bacterium]|nr:T9SS type A sorting domain-containing protein [Candidatus Fermentibacteraceae bacterium]MBN2607840.1 T9SS type A sorting domain-containing protein [Candidatus Fermentibacteraceae bacterium]